MLSLLLCAGEVVRRFFKRQEGFVQFDPLRHRQQLREASLIVVQKETSQWNPEYEDGLHFTAYLRLQCKCELPIVIVEPDPALQPSKAGMQQVYEDPYIRRLFFDELPNYNSPEQLLHLFDLSLNSKEQKLLFQDLRQTLYREEGYIDEFRHRSMRVLGRMKSWDDISERQQLIEYLNQAYDMACYWRPSLESEHSLIALKHQIEQSSNFVTYAPMIQEWFDRLCNSVKVEAVSEEPEEQEDINLLYISDDAENLRTLRERFQSAYSYYHICCIGVNSVESALAHFEDSNKKIIAVASDFRFRDVAGRVALRNGYNIIRSLRAIYPECLYSFLTNYPLSAYEALPIPPEVHIFKKNQVFTPGHRAFANFARQIISHKENTPSRQDAWPEALNGKDDKAWQEWYGRFISSADFEESEKTIAQEALAVIDAILEGRPFNAPKSGTQFHKLAKKSSASASGQQEIVLNGLQARLLTRRIYLGLFQLELSRFFPQFNRLFINSSSNDGGKRAMDLAYCALHQHNVEGGIPLSEKSLSNHFTNLRLIRKVDYRLESELRASHLTLAESRWLAVNQKYFDEKHAQKW